MGNLLHLKAVLPVRAINAGYFVTKGKGRHVDRVMDSFEIIYVSAGCLGIAEEEKEYNVEAGEALILYPGRHHWGTRDFDSDLTFYWLHFYLDEEANRTGQDIMALPQLIRIAKPEQFEELFRRFIKRQEVSQEKMKLIYTLGGKKYEVLTKVVLPASTPYLLSALKVDIGLCLVGVIIGEFIGARQGLGYLIIYSSQVFKLDWLILSIIILCAIAMILYQGVCFIEKWYNDKK